MSCPKCKSDSFCNEGFIKGKLIRKCKLCLHRYTVDFFFLSMWLYPCLVHAQSSDKSENVEVQIKFIDSETSEALSYAQLHIEQNGQTYYANDKGFIPTISLEKRKYTFTTSHIACRPQLLNVDIQRDTLLTVVLDHHTEYIDEVVLHGVGEHLNNKSKGVEATSATHKNILDHIDGIGGVRVARQGTSISTPILDGMANHRVTIVNEDIVHINQNWSADHAPEIDPYSIDRITVVRGANLVLYPTSSIGGAIQLSQKKIKNTDLSTRVDYGFHTNGQGHTAVADLYQAHPMITWRLTTSAKLSGDTHTPNYFLTNTGRKEQNASLFLEKKISDQWTVDATYRFTHTDIAIFRGAHISNTTDLEQAIGRDVPFFTKDDFSYEIENPRQDVTHHLLRLQNKWQFSPQQTLQLKYSYQSNFRKEFDVRRGDRDDIPALDLSLQSHFIDFSYENKKSITSSYLGGIQYSFHENDNDPATGILPIIPDYRNTQLSLYSIYKTTSDQLSYDVGLRYDYRFVHAQPIVRTTTLEVQNVFHHFHQYSAVGGVEWSPSEVHRWGFTLNHTRRLPHISELYSSGLHQGVASIEEGDPTLGSETSTKLSTGYRYHPSHQFQIEANAFYQYIDDFIFLNPERELRLTIRGSFPVFRYRQKNATLYGGDVWMRYRLSEHWMTRTNLQFIQGMEEDAPLVNMPPVQWMCSMEYTRDNLGNLVGRWLNKLSASVDSRYVFRQTSLLAEQDFIPTPPAYFVLDLKGSTQIGITDEQYIILSVGIENVLNRSYRDYLNRLRYFTDEVGRSAIFTLSVHL